MSAATRRRFVASACAGACAAGALAACGGGGGGSAPATPTAPTGGATPTPTPANEVRVPLMGVGQTVAASIRLVGGLVTPLAVTRTGETTVVAVSRVCTHENCTVDLPARNGASLDCPCHGSRFLVTGQVVNGPATRPLSSFPARIAGAEVVVSGV
ncbi:MAG: Rieske 2Fe-2S domain-containing protein [Vicinamibacteria bacterium]|nr:Rieske 2Fe-2S domain-containing protein [Vicinamibacteria bacterium]